MSHQVTSRCLPQHTLPPIYEVFVGRQPIYTQQLDVFAYALLFRSGELQHAGVTDGNQATAQVLVNTFLELGLDTLVELADIIKIDVLASGRTTVAEHVRLLRHYDVQLLAEKVETQEDFT